MMTENERRHPKRMLKIYTCGEENWQGVILNECEGSITVVRKAVSCHESHRFFTLCPIAAPL